MTPETEQQYKNQIAALQAEIEKLKNQQTKAIQREKYGLNWIDVPEEFDEKSKNSIPVLKEIKEKAIKNDDGKPTHILIEGDNYHALTCLNYTHAGKIDVIYIDPPYNTGSDGFTYKDARFMTEFPNGKTVPKDDPLRHSTWLSFMEKRLRLAKNLLSDKGVIFISIDDNEQANLKLLCDQIFGEKNFVACISCQANPGGDKGDYIETTLQYLVVYAKNINKLNDLGFYEDVDISKYPEKDNYGFYRKGGQLEKWGNDDTTHTHPNLAYSIYYNPEKELVTHLFDYNQEEINNNRKLQIQYEEPNKDLLKKGYFCIRPRITNAGEHGRWRLEVKTFYERFSKNEFIFKKQKDGYKIYEKERFSIGKFKKEKDFLDSTVAKQTSSELLDIFGNKVFDYPKPISLLHRIIKDSTHSNQESTILDFFAGSGTTLHATMKLNAEDGGNRQCILVQQQENDANICETITYERNRRVMQGYTNAKGEEIAGLGNSLKYYKTDFIGENDAEKAGDEDKITLAQKAGYLISLVENTLEEIETNDFYQIFSNAEENQFTAIYFNGDTEKFPDFVQSIQEKNKKTIVYIFTWGSPDIFENEFDDLTNITIKSIPQPILEIYKSLMKNEE